jgi:hypothetical protein
MYCKDFRELFICSRYKNESSGYAFEFQHGIVRHNKTRTGEHAYLISLAVTVFSPSSFLFSSFKSASKFLVRFARLFV